MERIRPETQDALRCAGFLRMGLFAAVALVTVDLAFEAMPLGDPGALAVVVPGGAVLALCWAIRTTAHLRRAVAALEETRAAADRANRAKSEFLADVGRELRAPLNAVLGYSQLLLGDRRERADERQADHLRQIIDGGDRILAFVNDVDDLSRIDLGRLDVVPAEFGAEDLLDDLAVMAARPAGEASVTLVIDAAAVRGALVRADHTRAKQCLFNLTTAAIAFSGAGGQVRVTAETADRTIRFTVDHDGQALSATRMAAMFQPFSRPDLEMSGIGLALTRRLAELMDGRVGVEGAGDKGGKLWIELPLARKAGSAGRTATATAGRAAWTGRAVHHPRWS